ncbi:hypothetical protein GOP47_0013426 [Adiantum capillus-veneris]|uniref:Uncharacterized protein n=1 Tax=Adiantum capillus-veneris TaxID=13818 RepID=A0A9D4UNH3_ADICA|nr:hypothetical protein GOP47_0013426 [Adiantum capillus-veneris]
MIFFLQFWIINLATELVSLGFSAGLNRKLASTRIRLAPTSHCLPNCAISTRDCGSTISLGKESPNDPTKWWENRNKRPSPHLKHQAVGKPLWVDSLATPSWAHGKLGNIVVVVDASHGSSAIDQIGTFLASLRACARNKDLERSISIHHHPVQARLLVKCSDAIVSAQTHTPCLRMARTIHRLLNFALITGDYGSNNSLGKESPSDPTKWWENRNDGPSPHLKYQAAGEPLWVDSWTVHLGVMESLEMEWLLESHLMVLLQLIKLEICFTYSRLVLGTKTLKEASTYTIILCNIGLLVKCSDALVTVFRHVLNTKGPPDSHSSSSAMPSQSSSPNTILPASPLSSASTPSQCPHKPFSSVFEADDLTSLSSHYTSSPFDAPAPTPRASTASRSSWPSMFSRASSSSSARNGSPRASNTISTPLGSREMSPRSDAESEAGTSREAENQQKVVGIKVKKEGNAANIDKLLTGDIVKNVSFEGKKNSTITLSSNHGKQGLFGGLRQYSCLGQKLIITVVRQGRGTFSTEAKLVNKNFKTSSNLILQDFQDQFHEFTFEDYNSPQEFRSLQEEQLQGMKVKAATMDISKSLQAMDNDPQTDSCYSMVVVPHWNTNLSRFDNMEETVSQAMSWFNASKISGVPLYFLNIQTEPFILQLESFSNSDLSSISSTGAYGLHPSRGAASLDVVRAIRIWFQFEFPELKIDLEASQTKELLGVGIGGTAEGFCYVTHVGVDTPASSTDLDKKLKDARTLKKKLLVTRVGNEKVLPWFMSDRKNSS